MNIKEETIQKTREFRRRNRNINIILSMMWTILAIIHIWMGYILNSPYSYCCGGFTLGIAVAYIFYNCHIKTHYENEDRWMNAYFGMAETMEEELKCHGKHKKKK